MHKDGAVTRSNSNEPWRTALGRITSFRYLILATVTVAAGVVAGGRGDWNHFVTAGTSLVGTDGLHFFVRHGDVQTGPLSLLLAWFLSFTPYNGFLLCTVVSGMLGLIAIRCLESARNTARDADRIGTELTTLVGGIVVVFWWAKLGGYGHLDDALVLAGAAAAALLARRDRQLLAAVLIGLAIATKPWAVIFVPLTYGSSGMRRVRILPALTALAIGASFWLPFVLAAPSTLNSLRPTVNIAADSVIHLFGFSTNDMPAWLRASQLGGAFAVAALVMWRGRVGGVIVAAIAVRLATDPGTWSYYTAGFMLGALAWDLLETRRVLPAMTLLSTIALLPPWIVHSADLRAALRLLICMAALVLALRRAPQVVNAPVRSGVRSYPTSDPAASG